MIVSFSAAKVRISGQNTKGNAFFVLMVAFFSSGGKDVSLRGGGTICPYFTISLRLAVAPSVQGCIAAGRLYWLKQKRLCNYSCYFIDAFMRYKSGTKLRNLRVNSIIKTKFQVKTCVIRIICVLLQPELTNYNNKIKIRQ